MSEWRLTEVVAKWLEAQEWEERPETKEERMTSSTEFSYQLNDDFTAKCFLEVVEKAGFFKVYMYYFDTKIPVPKINEVVTFANLANAKIPVGELIVHPEDNMRVIKFYLGMDFEDAAFEPQHISNMLSSGLRTLKERLPQMMAICFGGKSAEEAVDMEID